MIVMVKVMAMVMAEPEIKNYFIEYLIQCASNCQCPQTAENYISDDDGDGDGDGDGGGDGDGEHI